MCSKINFNKYFSDQFNFTLMPCPDNKAKRLKVLALLKAKKPIQEINNIAKVSERTGWSVKKRMEEAKSTLKEPKSTLEEPMMSKKG